MLLQVLTIADCYGEAVNRFKDALLMAPTYLTVGGTESGEGCVITRGREPQEELPVWRLDEHGPVVQTNMDWFRDDPGWIVNGDETPFPAPAEYVDEHDHSWQDICYSSTRRRVARAAILSQEGELSVEDYWLLLSTEPCLCEDTVYTTAMCASIGMLVTRKHVSRKQQQMGAKRWGTLAEMVAPEMEYWEESNNTPTRQ